MLAHLAHGRVMPQSPAAIGATRSRQQAERRGRTAEVIAAAMLIVKGYRIIGHRQRSRLGEIDLIAVRGQRLAFIEVKQRATHAASAEALSRRQAGRLADAAEQWLWQNPKFRGYEIGLDAVLLGPTFVPRHLPNALNAW